ncbi:MULTISPECIES: ABC transporter permease [Halocynthiibacter]|uniref:ABC transporter permease n=1 Tax=Halocynthiibacter halioticoli TaxID=2986804 RepID=A0AAE3LQK1_9RHOB|nr:MULTISPECIES: ABC transporter permease [Halocynthiibacter]MCV6823618.1 ABC transporter permease [Halocynthiibacter halioticoli]MCW4056619.1 ABC transporter permease [Halocynthiibacter sp. SDUM655004]MDE0590364.1 ABC transporter permease [Halocynthiibacter sp. C4]
MKKMPRWADVALIPILNLLIAFIISGLVLLAIGKDPWAALGTMIDGSFGSSRGVGYTLYYTTNFIFTGLAMGIASHARMFNIGGEGQAALGGLGVALILLAVPWPHWTLALPAAILFGGLFGAAWAFIPAYLQAKRGSHIVITTIMFNFIAASLMGYLLTGVLKVPGKMAAETAKFPEGAHLPTFHEMLAPFGIEFSKHAPANLSFLVALLCLYVFWILVWRTRLGYNIRAFGESESAAVYAGINPAKIIIITMLISGAFAGLMAINNVMGEAERLIHNAVEGAGFIGIAVALMGRNHPIGIFLAALLFGFLWQGGAELQFEHQIPREMVTVIQALVILLTGALDNMVRRPVEKLFIMRYKAKGL